MATSSSAPVAAVALAAALLVGAAQGEELATVSPGLWQAAASTGSVDCLVVLRDEAVAHAAAAAPGAPAARFATDWQERGADVRHPFAHLPIVRMHLPSGQLAALSTDPRVRGISRVSRAHAMRKQGKALMKVGDVQARGYSGQGVGIAVLDTGVDYSHPELSPGGPGGGAKTVKLLDAVDDDGDPRDQEGHGTCVAGIAAGKDGGVAPQATVVAVRVLNEDGEGSSEEILAGLDAVLGSVRAGDPHHIRVVNLSLGGYDDWDPGSGTCDTVDPAFATAFEALSDAGVLAVVAAGNGGCSTGVSWPACISSVLAVGAVYDDEICMDPIPLPFGCQSTSVSFGKSQCMRDGCTQDTRADRITCYSDSGTKLGVWAPSHCAKAPKKGGGYEDCFGGTSAAAPYTAGVVALLAQAYPRHGPSAWRAALEATGRARTDDRNGVTHNRVDAVAALDYLASYCTPPNPPGDLRADVQGLCGERSARVSWDAVLGAGQYRLQWSTALDFSSSQELATSGLTSVLSHRATAATTILVRVRAERSCGSVSAWTPAIPLPYTPECGVPARRHLRRSP